MAANQGATGRGLGSATKRQKGAEHVRIGAEKIIGPRIVYADTVTLDGSGDKTLKLPPVTGVTADYSVLVTDGQATAAAATAATLTVAAAATTIVLKGPASSEVHVLLVKNGLAV